MSDEEYQNRMNSAMIEEEELKHLANFVIDATLSPEEVLEQFLDIAQPK